MIQQEASIHLGLSDISLLESHLQYNFDNKELLAKALRHKSYANELKRRGLLKKEDNERLEFLGDAVLDLAMSEILMEEEPEAKEGVLSKKRASLVNEESLFIVSKKIQLNDFILLGKGERASLGQNKPRLLSCCLEAIIGAVFRDSDYPRVKKVIKDLFIDLIHSGLEQPAFEKDYKTRFQEVCQKDYYELPHYEIVYEVGPAHQRLFTSEIFLRGKWLARGCGYSKKIAQQVAAKKALEVIGDI